MTAPPEVPEPRHLREWLSWVATERWDELLRSARRWCLGEDPSAVDGVIHDGMLKILAGEVELPNDPQRAWRALLATIHNVARNRHRSEKLRRTEPLDQVRPSVEQVRDGWDSGWRICQGLEREQALHAALEILTADQREVVELRYFEEGTIAEVAVYRGCSQSAVKQLTATALANLRMALDGPFAAD